MGAMTDPTPVRLSHLLGGCAPGALIRGAQAELLVAMDSRYWCDDHGAPQGRVIVNVPRLRSALGVTQELVTPPTANLDDQGRITGTPLPALRFPAWTHCDACGGLYFRPWSRQQSDHPRCTNPDCQDPRPLQQVPWILAHQRGYMDELPWHWLIHRQGKGKHEGSECHDNTGLSFQLYQGTLQLACRACGARAEYPAGAILADNFFMHLTQMVRQPWVRERVPVDALRQDPPVALEIGDVRLFAAESRKGLVIPPESRLRPDPVATPLKNGGAELEGLRQSRAIPALYESKLRLLAQQLGCTPEAVAQALDGIDDDQAGQVPDIRPGQLLSLEYQALTTPIPDLEEREDFVTRHLSRAWREQADDIDADRSLQRILATVDQVVAVQRLREVMVYTGFTRKVRDKPSLVPPDLDGVQRWLPAVELYGEGLFLSFSEPMIAAWERQAGVLQRAGVLRRRALDAGLPDPSPRFMLLHTLAHLMIRNLEIHSGYPAAALKERLYIQVPDAIAGNDNQTRAMAGILIYASVPDKAGTLGGLAEAAEPARLLALLEAVFQQARWCSLDPVCAEHEGQGPQLLNRAACHACALVPDSACDYGNVLLDRCFINGAAAAAGQQAFDGLLHFAPGRGAALLHDKHRPAKASASCSRPLPTSL